MDNVPIEIPSSSEFSIMEDEIHDLRNQLATAKQEREFYFQTNRRLDDHNIELWQKNKKLQAENERLRDHLDLVDPGGRVVAAPAQNPESK